MDILRRLRYLNSIGPSLKTLSLKRLAPVEKVHGRLLKYDPTIKTTGVRYLRRNLSTMEANTLYDSARAHGEAFFQDARSRNFTLTYNRQEGTYHLEPRTHD